MNEFFWWFCDISDKLINIKNKSKHIISQSHKHKEKFGVVVVKEYQFNKPDSKKRHYINNNCARDCYNKYFQTFKSKCIYDIEMTNGDFVNGKFSDKKIKQIVQKIGFIHKLTLKSYQIHQE